MSFAGLRRRSLSTAIALAAVAGSTTITACGGGGGDGTPTDPQPNPTIAIALSASTLEVQQGASGNVTVTVTRGGGYTGAVTVAVEGLPTGVTAPSATIASGTTSATLSFTAAATAAAATAPLTIRATGTGVSAVTSSLSLTVRQQPVQAGSFSLSLSPASISVTQGGSQTVTVNITRTGSFTGAVTLSVTGAGTGLTPTLSATSVTGNNATITLAAASNATTGAQTLTVRGTGTGASDQSASLAVTVNASQQSSGNVSWKFCGTSGLPLWVAAQDGTGAWSRVTGTADTYSFNVGSRGGVAYVVPLNGGFELQVFYGTLTELQAQGNDLCSGAVGAGKTVSATVAGAASTDMVLASLGRSTASVNMTLSPPITFSGVQSGNVDLVASKSTLQLVGFTPTFNLSKMIIRRGINPAAGSTLALDFNAAEAFDPITRNVTINNLNSEISLAVGMYLTAGNSFGAFLTDITGATGNTRTYKGVPAANQVSGDLHLLSISALPSLTQTNQTRNVITVFKDAVDKTVSLGPALTAPTVTTLSGGGYGRTRAVISVQNEYSKYFAFDVQQTTTSSPRKTTIQATSNYSGGGSSLTLDIPDFSGVAGFDATWGLRTGTSSTWTLSATGWTASGGTTAPTLSDGTSYLSGTRMGTVTP